MKKQLPLNEPPIKTYYHHALALSILATRDDFLPWFYSNYIQLHVWDGKYDFYEPWTHSGHIAVFCPLLYIRVIDRDLVGQMCGSIVSFIKGCIEKDYYVRLKIDEFFIPDTVLYQREHGPHLALVKSHFQLKQSTGSGDVLSPSSRAV